MVGLWLPACWIWAVRGIQFYPRIRRRRRRPTPRSDATEPNRTTGRPPCRIWICWCRRANASVFIVVTRKCWRRRFFFRSQLAGRRFLDNQSTTTAAAEEEKCYQIFSPLAVVGVFWGKDYQSVVRIRVKGGENSPPGNVSGILQELFRGYDTGWVSSSSLFCWFRKASVELLFFLLTFFFVLLERVVHTILW